MTVCTPDAFASFHCAPVQVLVRLSQIPHLDDPEVLGLKQRELNTTMIGVQFHFSVSFADLERLRGSERSFEQPKQINRGDLREFFFFFGIPATSPPTDVTRNSYSGMRFALLPGEVFSNFGDSLLKRCTFWFGRIYI